MRRREALAAGTTAVVALAGCSRSGGPGNDGGSSVGRSEPGSAPFEHPGTLEASFATNGDYPVDGAPADGRPPAFPDPPAAPEVDEGAFERTAVNGESVRLAPLDVVKRWYLRAEARFVDARGLAQYERAHVYGSVLSTAQEGSTGGGVDGWPLDDRVVTYCGCPHHLSSLRAAGLRKAGFTRVFALDVGFRPWAERGYPMAGSAFVADASAAVAEWTIEGVVPPRYAGEYAWAAADRQYEAAPVRADGRFTLAVRFPDATAETPVRVSTPAYAVTRPLGELASGVLEG